MFHVPNQFRIRSGQMGSDDSIGNNGAFMINLSPEVQIGVIAADDGGWEHVSASLRTRCPLWSEMCAIKDLFWDPEDCVMQFHPPRSYVNCHPYCLHLWRPIAGEILRPPKWMVG